ncbi:large ribosomal subunit protein uL2m [Drosophila nasuta]|uniref:39S ribosomal protein L2, mitochondrial n=1 Tax=Drosophila albomicans TaxID=7291 RepID=A0A6P8Y063_DROAB|nr:39S ribosomal protein L2, mitochondrial [Drosophila albomicans]XP_060651838.1 large ribosomal subunit protein uL2m [Drosophila nasuta]
MQSLTRLLANCTLTLHPQQQRVVAAALQQQQLRTKTKYVEKPKPGAGQQFRRIVHFPEEYTVQPLKITHLAGRDPVTGRMVAKGIGGGIKQQYRWIKWVRDGPSEEGATQEERVVELLRDGCRTAKVALVAVGDELKYILATENMREGDILKTSRFIPRIPVRPNEGDAYPLGALPAGTRIHCLEKNPGQPCHLIHAAGTFGTILRKFDDKVVVQLPSKREFAFDRTCMATVGRLSNIEHNKEHVGSAQRMREMGNRPRSGLWKRKEGKHGRKVRRLPPMTTIAPPAAPKEQEIRLTLNL